MPICPKCEKGDTGPHPSYCTPEMRFWHKVRIAPNGCWEWQGARSGGYGIIRLSKTVKVYAHRFAYEGFNGPLAPGELVRHRCDNPPCVRGVHLLSGSHADNTADMIERGRQRFTARKTHCIRGHAFTPENTMKGKGGAQRCRECENAARRKIGGRGPRVRRAA